MLPRSRTLPSRIYNGVVEERQDTRHYLRVEVQPKAQQETEAIILQANDSICFDDDGRIKRTGTFWTATSHILTAVIGSGVLSLAWAIGQLGWIAGPAVMLLVAFVILYTSNLLSQCYKSGNPVTGSRNHTYMDAVKATLGGKQVKVYGLIQYINLFCVANCSIGQHDGNKRIKLLTSEHSCRVPSNGYMITFVSIEIIFSQIPDFDQVWWLSMVVAIMSFTYSTIGLALSIAKVAENSSFKGSLTGISIGTGTHAGTVNATQLWNILQALGAIGFAYLYSVKVIEIQDTIKSPPAEYKTMKKATLLSIAITTIFYLLCGCIGYAAFGDNAPGNILTSFGFYNPYWLLDIANVAVVIHIVGAYQLNFFRLLWRTAFVIVTTSIAMLMPFFEDVVGILGALGFWPLTVYFPIEMYIAQKKIGRWTNQWIGLQILSAACFLVSQSAAIGSVAGFVFDLKVYTFFKTSY